MKKPRSKRIGRKPKGYKRRSSKNSSNGGEQSQSNQQESESSSKDIKDVGENCNDLVTTESVHNSEVASGNSSSQIHLILPDHDYCNTPETPTETLQQTEKEKIQEPGPYLQELFLKVKERLEPFLPKRWMIIVDKTVVHVVYVSLQICAAIQRSLVVFPSGQVQLFVHNQRIDANPFEKKLGTPVFLNSESINCFVDRIASMVNSVSQMEVCSGYDDVKFQTAWSTCSQGEIDKNNFNECRFIETFRSFNCSRLVTRKRWRCFECKKLYGPLKRKAIAAAEEARHLCTKNKYLTVDQLLKKLETRRMELDAAKKQIYRLQNHMEELIKKQSVPVDHCMSDDLLDILNNAEIAPAQSIFLQQQIKASQQINASGMRWHPTMIRFALAIHLTSPAAYDLMRQTGMVKLPSNSTLFNYLHVKPVQEGIDSFVLESVEKRVRDFPEKHKKFHVLMADEMHVSQNLVFQKSNGRLLGYATLDDLDSEIRNLEQLLDNLPEKEIEENVVASKVLVYMIKGVSNGIKEVVATYTTSNVTANQMYIWTWKVIGALERSGIAVVAFASDGSSVNRSFIKRHKPASDHKSGILFDTWNKASRGRKLYFIADVPHLLKTIRNCMLNSRWDGLKSRRKMVKNGKKITWDFVIKLYEGKKNKSLRKSFKLNAMNVYPDSYARMKVKYAGQVLSFTVCVDMRSQNWEDSSETTLFIQLVNEWFDCLNGAHSSQATRTRNANLAPYTSTEDVRFQVLTNFLNYLDDWEKDAHNAALNTTVAGDNTVAADCNESEIEDAFFNPAEDTPASKRILSKQTLDGIRMTTLAFQPLVTYLLEEGASFVNARIFCQDPLEQHFSKVRAGQGGSNNPNVFQVLNRNRALHTIGQLGMRKRKGNSAETANTVEVTSEPLPKRVTKHVPKFA